MKRALILVAASLLKVAAVEAQATAPDATVKLLAELTNANGAPGFEGPVRDILRREWRSLLADLRTDGLGNLLGRLPGSAPSPRVLLMAHMDEVGFLVRAIDERGFVYMNPLGGYIDQSVLTQRYTIMTPRGPVIGYTGFKSTHIVSPEERYAHGRAPGHVPRHRRAQPRRGGEDGRATRASRHLPNRVRDPERHEPLSREGLGRPGRPRGGDGGAPAVEVPPPPEHGRGRGDGAGGDRPARRRASSRRAPIPTS